MTTRLASHARRRDVFRGEVRAFLEQRLAGLIRIGEDGGVDVDDDLVALARGAGVDAVVEGRFREQHQRVGLLLSHRRRFRGTQHVAIATPRPTETSYASRVEGPEVGDVRGANEARRGT